MPSAVGWSGGRDTIWAQIDLGWGIVNLIRTHGDCLEPPSGGSNALAGLIRSGRHAADRASELHESIRPGPSAEGYRRLHSRSDPRAPRSDWLPVNASQ